MPPEEDVVGVEDDDEVSGGHLRSRVPGRGDAAVLLADEVDVRAVRSDRSRLCRDDELCKALATNGRKLVESRYDWTSIGERLHEVLLDAGRRPGGARRGLELLARGAELRARLGRTGAAGVVERYSVARLVGDVDDHELTSRGARCGILRRGLASVLLVQEHDLVSEGSSASTSRSVEPSSHTAISCGGIVCATAEAMASRIVSAAWKAATITENVGGEVRGAMSPSRGGTSSEVTSSAREKIVVDQVENPRVHPNVEFTCVKIHGGFEGCEVSSRKYRRVRSPR